MHKVLKWPDQPQVFLGEQLHSLPIVHDPWNAFNFVQNKTHLPFIINTRGQCPKKNKLSCLNFIDECLKLTIGEVPLLAFFFCVHTFLGLSICQVSVWNPHNYIRPWSAWEKRKKQSLPIHCLNDITSWLNAVMSWILQLFFLRKIMGKPLNMLRSLQQECTPWWDLMDKPPF